ncbi:hypothetical protein QD228_13570 [Cobetia sp. 3AK]|uniref:hypothetical protein n=1 Tax=Cobetia sp. 3AK TaxID=3040020 RepID=UPI00244CD37D|nr:hypothetical protein [Cobetia sp. 3AK]MDH2374870.1 hypothetical protein [Cobetia sp. 3AK]
MLKSILRWWRRPENSSGYVGYLKTIENNKVRYELRFFPDDEEDLPELKAYSAKPLLITYQEDGWDVEQTLLDHFMWQAIRVDRGKRAGRNIRRDRCGAIFDKDVLGLDDQLYAEAEKAKKEARLKEEGDAEEGCLSLIIAIVLAPFTLGLSLLFVLYGGFCLRESAKSTGKREQYEKTIRPVHPEKIQALLRILIDNKALL